MNGSLNCSKMLIRLGTKHRYVLLGDAQPFCSVSLNDLKLKKNM